MAIAPIGTSLTNSMNNFQNVIVTREAYAATIALTPNAQEVRHVLGLLTGNLAYNIAAPTMATGDGDGLIVRTSFVADGSARTITWGANITANAATLVLDASQAKVITFMYDDTLDKWLASTGETEA